jgi:osmoprotectant transport system ATP-binding protein
MVCVLSIVARAALETPVRPRAADAVIEFHNVSHTYNHVVALEDVSLGVAAGETVALIGPSGCGKSTLLKLAVGVLWPRRGEVRIAGEPLHPGNAIQVRRRIGYVIQSGGLFPHLTAAANVTLLARRVGREPAWIERRVAELSDLVRLPLEALQRDPHDLSGGQRQRVSLMRALMLDPDLLLLDEPLGALDPMVRYELQEELRELFARLRKTVVLVTHDMAEAAFFAPRLVLMHAGRIVQQGSWHALTEAPATEFVTQFVRAQRRLHQRENHA